MSYKNACNICGATSSEWIGPKDDVCMHCSEYVNGIELRERERIIKLLEERCIEWGKSWGGYCSLPIDPEHCQECYETVDTIALIKGETNE